MGFIERIQAKIELFRLEQRYTRRRNRRSTFVSNAVYVDGEYIYNTPAATGSSTNSSSTNASSARDEERRQSASPAPPAAMRSPVNRSFTTDNIPEEQAAAEKPGKKLNRYSSMPGFGSLSKSSGRNVEWRTNTTISEVR